MPPQLLVPISRKPAARLLAWYDRHRRHLPWRADPGAMPAPYRVWLSEIMLQQTTVATVGPYFARFLERWPTVEALAGADLDAVLHAWQGLGYYARARNLHKCAKVVAQQHGGRFPDTEEELRSLPGVGDYTAAAVAAIAFGRKATPVDGNIVRVIARYRAVGEALPGAKSRIVGLARELTPNKRAGDFAQALMDIGATICTPRAPKCDLCPWRGDCRARAEGTPDAYPVKVAKKPRPVRHGIVFWALDRSGRVLLRRRPEKGLLGGLMEFPSTPWRAQPWTLADAATEAPAAAAWRLLPDTVEHTFTHFHLKLSVAVGRTKTVNVPDATWCAVGRLGDHALPTAMKKVADLVAYSS